MSSADKRRKMSSTPSVDPRAVQTLMEWATEQYDFPRRMNARAKYHAALFPQETFEDEEMEQMLEEGKGDATLLALTSLGPSRARHFATRTVVFNPPPPGLYDDRFWRNAESYPFNQARRLGELAVASRKKLATHIELHGDEDEIEWQPYEEAQFLEREYRRAKQMLRHHGAVYQPEQVQRYLHSAVAEPRLNAIIDAQYQTDIEEKEADYDWMYWADALNQKRRQYTYATPDTL